MKIFNTEKSEAEEMLQYEKADRRRLNYVPDPEEIRKNQDRRGTKGEGKRYIVKYRVKVSGKDKKGKKFSFICEGADISQTGILLKIDTKDYESFLSEQPTLKLRFYIKPGSMPEGYEMHVRNRGRICRVQRQSENEAVVAVGVEFVKSLKQYVKEKRGRWDLFISSVLLFLISAFIILMRAESIIYFKFNRFLYLYSILAATFLLTRYLFAMFYKTVPVNQNFTPGVSIIIPCFNEEKWIQRTILNCINQDYPPDKLEVIIVDDCSTDQSANKIKEIVHTLYEESARFQIKSRLHCIFQQRNAGKREALALGVEAAKHELVVFVDSDSFLEHDAIRNLVQPFKDPKVGGCSGRTDVANTYTNTLTKMQAVRYYIAFRIMKAAEGRFDAVSCLSGPLSCYRKCIVEENREAWLKQKFLGQKATFGDDRSMTNFILKKYRTAYQDTAVCSTIVPSSYSVFLRQQMRWKRSWLRESLIASGFMWKKEPFAAFGFYAGLFVPIAAPIVVIYNLFYIPFTHHIFPTTFLVGILMMSLLMSMSQLRLRKSTTWCYGLFFCLYYEVVLLWQMPIAWFTFWKSTWGTRMTPSDIMALNRRKRKNEDVKSI